MTDMGEALASLTEEGLLAYLAAAVEAKGEDFVYAGAETGVCYYALLDEHREAVIGPDCLIGHVLWAINPLILTDINFRGDNNSTADDTLLQFGASPEVIGRAMAAQRVQDDGLPWGDALAAARSWDPEVVAD